MKITALILAVFRFIAVSAYVIPEPEIELLLPHGVRVSIPDVTGIQLFTFNGHVNRNIDINTGGSISGEVFRPTSGRWIFQDFRAIILGRDVLHYWIYVQFNGTPHTTTGSWSIPRRPKPCTPSVTTTSQQGVICQNQLILEDNFDSLNTTIWARGILIPSSPHYEFCVYHNHPESVEIRNGILHVSTSLLEDSYGEGTLRGTLRLAGCTSQIAYECNRTAVAFNILPPAISARLTTAEYFSFRYGRVEIRAKFPEGDWLFPEMWLQPKNPSETSGPQNVRVRLGMARGNRVLTGTQNDYSGRLLEFGLRAGSAPQFQDVQKQILRIAGTPWTSDFHIYSTTWNTDGFVFHVDGEEVGRVNPGPNGWFGNSTNTMVPFNEQFYITIGVGVGGLRDFPDDTRSGDGQGYEKPWRNVAAKAMLQFWQKKHQWFPSWRGSNSHLQIDYVRVWAL